MEGKLVLVSGHCAAGKSAFADRLSAELGILCFRKDRVKETLGEGLGPTGGAVYEKGSTAAFVLLEYILEECLKAGTPCILEGNFRPAELERVEAFLERYGGRCLSFFFTADMAVLYRRYRDREKERHWVHKSAGDSPEDFAAGQARLGEKLPGEVLLVDTTDFSRVDYSGLLTAVRAFLAG